MNEWLDPNLCKGFRDAINSSPIFVAGGEKQHYNLICAVMDRLDSCISYMNDHQKPPKSENDFIMFVTFGCMVVDAVKKLLKDIGYGYKYANTDDAESYQFFKEICKGHPLSLSDDQCPTDDSFVEYFRALAFAHPFETSRPKFFKKGEMQYSPWVIANGKIMKLRGIDDGVGIRIYSTEAADGLMDLCFPFSVLTGYIKSRYELIENATEWAKDKIEQAETGWGRRKVQSCLSPVDVLKDIADILDSRFEEHYSIDTAIEHLECETTVPGNDPAITEYRAAITSLLPALCDAVDALDNELVAQTVNSVIDAQPQQTHGMFHYQMEKILCYLVDYQGEENIKWGLQQALSFAGEFAKKHVAILPYDMSFGEVKFLVATACYLENKEQENAAVNSTAKERSEVQSDD
jgi:hypothetical protein